MGANAVRLRQLHVRDADKEKVRYGCQPRQQHRHDTHTTRVAYRCSSDCRRARIHQQEEVSSDEQTLQRYRA